MKFVFALLALSISCAGIQRPTPVEEPVLKVSMEVDLTEHINSVTEGMQWWNDILGCKVFDWGYPSNVHIMKADPIPNILAIVWKRGGGKIMTVHSKLNPEQQVFVFAHEFGHVLGLAHTPKDRDNIMYPSARDSKGSTINGQSGISKFQRDVLRGKYCR